MDSLTNLILGVVEFPSASGIGQFVYWLIGAMHNGGAVTYGVAIILFTIILKLILLPLDFANRFFSKRNAAQLAKLKPEEDELKEQYADDPMALNRAKQALYKKSGYKMTGFCLFSILNIVLTITIFFNVFSALRGVSDYNINLQFKNELQPVYVTYENYEYQSGSFVNLFDENAETILGQTAYNDLMEKFSEEINAKYNETKVGFLWVSNIWRSDTFWEKKTFNGSDWDAFKGAISGVQGSVLNLEATENYYNTRYPDNDKPKVDNVSKTWNELSTPQKEAVRDEYAVVVKSEFEAIYGQIGPKNNGPNGFLILILLSGAMTYFSVMLTTKLTAKAKKKEPAAKEAVVQYSMREVKNQADKPQVPNIDPQMMNKVMKFALPVVMIVFTAVATSALAIYITTSSLIGALITLGLNWPVDKLVAWEQKRKSERSGNDGNADPNIINPHAKYFKKRK